VSGREVLGDLAEVSEAPGVSARAALLFVSLVAAACSHAPDEPRAGAGSAGHPSTFSREAFAPAPGDAGAGQPPVPAIADPATLEEILAAAPPVAKGGAAPQPLLGTDTGLAPTPDANPEASVDPGADGPPAERGRRPVITIGKVTHERGAASASLERAARAQLYWPLVQRCREDGGAFLPPEVVHLSFQLDREGYVVPSSILALPREARVADAARCIARELSIVGFRAPAGGRGLDQAVTMDVPSVD